MSDSYHQRHLQLRAKRGSEDPIAIILEYLESLPYEYDVQQESRKLLISKHMVHGLRKRGCTEEEIKSVAYRDIGYFEGIINSIRSAAGIEGELFQWANPATATFRGLTLVSDDQNKNGKKNTGNSSEEEKDFSNPDGINEAKNILGIG